MKRYMFMILAVCLIPIFAMIASADQGVNDFSKIPDTVSENAKLGLVYDGLKRTEKCGAHGWEDVSGICTHGPDAAPAGIDVTEIPSTEQLVAAATVSAYPPCFGDGVSGKRVQAIYVVAADKPNRFATVEPLIQSTYGYRMNEAFSASAQAQGGQRSIRFVTGPDCKIVVAEAVIPAEADDTFGAMVTALRGMGFTSADRKYILWADAAVYCGVASVTTDTQHGDLNRANTGPHFARVDAGCWGSVRSVEAHELAHNIGAVQLNTPHSSGGWHCNDDYDRMCYSDGGATSNMVVLCPDTLFEALFDCNRDDYFSINPEPGSFLDTYWNMADSMFLTDAVGNYPENITVSPTPTPTTSSVSPTPTLTSPSPTPTKTRIPKKCVVNPAAPGCPSPTAVPEITETVVE